MTITVTIRHTLPAGKSPNPHAHRVVVVKKIDGGAYEEVRTLLEGESLDFVLYQGVTLSVKESP